MINRHSQRTYGADSITPEQVAHWFTMPDIDVGATWCSSSVTARSSATRT
jgi:hypothetical protein